MQLTVEHCGPLRPRHRAARQVLSLDAPCDVEAVLLAAGYADHELERLNVMVNGRRADLYTGLEEGDEVVLTLLAGGG